MVIYTLTWVGIIFKNLAALYGCVCIQDVPKILVTDHEVITYYELLSYIIFLRNQNLIRQRPMF